MDMENGNHSDKRQRLNNEAPWPPRTMQNIVLPPIGSPRERHAPPYSQPPRPLSSPHPPYPEGGSSYHDHAKFRHAMPESRQPTTGRLSYPYTSDEVKRESDGSVDSQYRPASSQPPPFPPSRPGENNSHHRSPPSYSVNPPYEQPNGSSAIPYRAGGMPPALSISGGRTPFDPRYAQSPDAAVSADGIYSPSPYGVPQSSTSGKKKAQRASQACDSCRSLKAKCDESKPCQSCKDKGIDCTYRQPEPKAQDKIQTDMANNIKTLLQEFTSIQSILQGVTAMRQDINRLTDRIQMLEQKSTGTANHVSTTIPNVLKTEETEPGDQNGFSSSQQSENSHRSETTVMPPTKNTEKMEVDSGAWQESASDEEMAAPLNPKRPKFGIQHTTGAVEILNWPAITDLVSDEVKGGRINKGKGAKTDRYLWKAEKRRGEIRTHGYGEGKEGKFSRDHDGDGSEGAASSSDASSPQLFSEPQYGRIASHLPYQVLRYSVGKKSLEEQNGGLTAEGTLDLSEATVRRLIESYREKMNILHPILSKKEIERLTNKFLQEVKSMPDSGEANREKRMSANKFLGYSGPVLGKRSRSTPDRGESSSLEIGRQLPEASPSNAIVLLMLAIGKICESQGKPEVIWGRYNMSPADIKKVKGSTSPDHSSPSSPASSGDQTSPHSHQNPTGHQQHHLPSFRVPELERSDISGKPPPVKNQDVIPGMAYMAIANDIIGDQLSGSTIHHIQAFILASLYFGQLVRPVQSHGYLFLASRAIQDQIRLKSSLTNLPEQTIQCKPEDNPLVYAFWTCLQLECDIVAELACVHSGILGYEELMPYPNTAASVEADEMSQEVAWSYDAQLWLRKHLNDIHAHYTPLDPNSSFHLFKDRRKNPTYFSSIEAVETARREQFSFNSILNQAIWPTLTWNFDADRPDLAKDILNARTRAKFYGARVITYRPFVEAILEHSWDLQHVVGGKNPPTAKVDSNALPGVSNWEFGDTPKKYEGPPDAPMEEKVKASYGEAHWKYFRAGISALINSTTPFYGMDSSRLIVTNVFGTVHAQWGNVLVLLAVYRDLSLRDVLLEHITEVELRNIVKKTLKFLKDVAPTNSGLHTDINILKAAALKANILTKEELGTPTPGSAIDDPLASSMNSSFTAVANDTEMS